MMESINNINYKVTKIFQNPNINFFIIMLLILLISCYTFINMSLKYMITSFVSNPIVILFILMFVILIGFYNINIAVLVLLLLFIVLYGTTIFNNNTNNNKILNKIEGFTDDSNDDDNDDNDDNDNDSDSDDDDYEADKKKLLSTIKQNLNESNTNDTVDSIKNTIFGTMNQLKDSGESEYKKSLLENKTIQYKNEKKINKQKQRNINNNSSSNSNSKNSRSSNRNNSKKESFQTINTRSFDPNKEEDTNFLITKEILQDMINRVDYNFESSKYLKKYLKHRIEEIVELNKLLDDDDD